jgi:hypothetical protein
MQDFIARWFGWVTAALVPRAPRRRSPTYGAPVRSSGAGGAVERFEGADHALVRPYQIAHEERRERVRQLERWIHGVEVAR